jgi:hypothetical protein
LSAVSGDTNLVQPGAIHLENLPLAQVLDLYAAILGRERVGGDPIPSTQLSLSTQTALTRQELTYSFETLLRWQGLEIELGDGETFRVVRRGGVSSR